MPCSAPPGWRLAVNHSNIMASSVSTYKGHPIITLGSERFAPSFGLAKAKAILAHVEDIKRFVAEHDVSSAYDERPTRNQRIIDSGYAAYAREEGHDSNEG